MGRFRRLAGSVLVAACWWSVSPAPAQTTGTTSDVAPPKPAPAAETPSAKPTTSAKTVVATPAVPAPTREEQAVLQALQANPITAPYRIGVSMRLGKMMLTGRVGTSTVHDAAVRAVIALGYPVRDELVIDTTEAVRVNAASPPRGRVPVSYGLAMMYPPPLFGRLDEPFMGFEPPMVTMPPWYGAVARRQPISPSVLNSGQAPMYGAGQGAIGPGGIGPGAVDPGAFGLNATGDPLPKDTVEATIDTNGVAVLRGVVNTLDERIGIGQKLAKQPGVAQVINLLEVVPRATAGGTADTPPPPPTPPTVPLTPPATHVPDAPRDLEPEKAPVLVDSDPLSKRISAAITKRPALEGLAIKIANRDGVVTLSGKVPSAFEAMLAYRAAEQTVGVKEVIDRMEFTLPDADAPNPLKTKGRPEDIEPYLLTQVRRQVGDLAHVDQVRVRGDSLEIRGTLARADDAGRVEALLRSIPLLRGFRLDPTFVAE